MTKDCGYFLVFLVLASTAVRLAEATGPTAEDEPPQNGHVRGPANDGESQCQACSKEVCVRVETDNDCSSRFEIVGYQDQLAALENRIYDVLNATVTQEQMISSLETLIQALEQKIDSLIQQ